MSGVGERDPVLRIENSELKAIADDLREVADTVGDLAHAVKSLEERPLKRRLVDDLRLMTINLEQVSNALARVAARGSAARPVA